jgi:hypothetical protein
MKHILISLLLVFTALSLLHSQNASTYFPASTGYKWYYKNTPLDSNNNPLSNLATYRIDSFAVVAPYKGLTANIVRFKDYMPTLNQNTPYNDTMWYNFNGTNAYQYLNTSLLPDTMNVPIAILNFFRGLQSWYNMYQFASPVGTTYQMFSKDTTILINSVPMTFRAKASGKRLNDETVSTVNGTYTAKKFAFTSGLYLVVLIFETPIVVAPDTIWTASNVWMVKRFSPSVRVDMSSVGYGTLNVPGKIYTLTLPVGIKNISSEVPDKYSLSQNYPNPFNPGSIIKFKIKDSRFVTLKVYDGTGKEVAGLVNSKLQLGEYEANFNGSGLSSGVYYYKLTAGEYSETKKMLLIK